MQTSKRVNGLEHPHTLISMLNLSATYYAQGRWTAAETLQVEALGMAKRVLGDDHSHTLIFMLNLAHTFNSQGRDKEAIDLLEDALRMQLARYGPDHVHTVRMAGHLNAWKARKANLTLS